MIAIGLSAGMDQIKSWSFEHATPNHLFGNVASLILVEHLLRLSDVSHGWVGEESFLSKSLAWHSSQCRRSVLKTELQSPNNSECCHCTLIFFSLQFVSCTEKDVEIAPSRLDCVGQMQVKLTCAFFCPRNTGRFPACKLNFLLKNERTHCAVHFVCFSNQGRGVALNRSVLLHSCRLLPGQRHPPRRCRLPRQKIHQDNHPDF